MSVVGDPFEPTTFQGPQVPRAQHENVLRYIQSARDEGATVYMVGGVRRRRCRAAGASSSSRPCSRTCGPR